MKEKVDLSLFQEKQSGVNYGFLDSSCGHVQNVFKNFSLFPPSRNDAIHGEF